MRAFILLFMLTTATAAFAVIPVGTYKADNITCKSGKVMHFGGDRIHYSLTLEVMSNMMRMTATVKSQGWFNGILNCIQVNEGSYVYTQASKYEGELPNIKASCNFPPMTAILKAKLYGVEEYGEFNYSVVGNKLTIFNPQTVTKYSCTGAGDYPIYNYTRI